MSDVENRLRNQSEMLAAIAHDLRHTLLRAGLSADLARDERDEDTRAKGLRTIIEALSAMTRLVDDLDDFSCLQNGRLRVFAEHVDSLEIIEATRRAFDPLARARSIALTSSASTALRVAGDRERLIQALSNLLGNALRHTPRGGLVVLSACHDGDAVRFTVSDTGSGIAPDDLPHLFERYWRGPGAGCPGRGLGLAITRGLVAQHGGTIWAENKPSGGASFSFTIPRA
jgi:signal transduction histidine kinase